MVTYPGLPAPTIGDHLTRAASRSLYRDGTEFHIGRIEMVANTGTYLDVPFHRYPDGVDLATFPLDRMVDLPCVVARFDDGQGSGGRGIGADDLADLAVGGAAVLLHTGWDRQWGTDRYGVGAPFLTEAGALHLVERGAVLVGIDSVNIDDVGDGRRPAHSVLLAAGVPIVEHLCNLAGVPEAGARFHAPPPAVAGMGTFTVRAYVVVEGAEGAEGAEGPSVTGS
jgi:kynurenine formamidase